MNKTESLWGGRFTEKADETFVEFNRSFNFDKQLFAADIEGCLGHCRGLENAGVLSSEDAKAIRKGLDLLLSQAAQRSDFFEDSAAEDVHSFIETKLNELIGDTGRKLHTGRSRNDQVATALRIWMRGAVDEVLRRIVNLQSALLHLADGNKVAVLPGYTHLQRAQPVLFAHWCLAYFEMLRRDYERFTQTRARINILPLASAALAGTSYPIDREAVAIDLGFDGITRNSLDAVSDRDFCIDLVYAASVTMMHLSRFAEDIILYCTTEFGFFTLSDKVSTGSSIMPQKKNPDSMELVRGKSGRVFGDLIALLTTMKGLPLAYNKDMQEDKEAVFDAFSTVRDSLEVSTIVIQNISVNKDQMLKAATSGYLNATELADYLAKKDIPFRRAHEIVGQIVLYAIDKGVELEELSLEEMQTFASEIEKDVFAKLTLEQTLNSKSAIGGTSNLAVNKALSEAKKYLADF
ncbi:MAG: argininosuccinate lyase [Pyrinomonadaceae bacterium]|nr:argininosuccinate lyase [Pyrinomonadaceae bacterium]